MSPKKRTSHGRRPLAPVVAISSGKGGVGKTTVVANLSVALAQLGLRVTVLDGDMSLANIDVLFGLTPDRTIEDFFAEEISLSDLLISGPSGVQMIPGGSGLPDLAALPAERLLRFAVEIARLRESCDVLLLDTPAGISPQVLRLLRLADRVLLVAWPEPASLVDAYALIKLLNARRPTPALGVIVNGARDRHEATRVHARLRTACSHFLGFGLELEGWILRDESVPIAARNQRPVILSEPNSPASRGFARLAQRIAVHAGRAGGGKHKMPCPEGTKRTEVIH